MKLRVGKRKKMVTGEHAAKEMNGYLNDAPVTRRIKLLGKKRLAVGVLLAALLAGGVGYQIIRDNPSGGNLANGSQREGLEADLEAGKCSETTKKTLSKIDESEAAAKVAKAYEFAGLCQSYDEALDAAKSNYIKAREFYKKAGDTVSADRMSAAIESIDGIKEFQAKDYPKPGDDPSKYPELEGGGGS